MHSVVGWFFVALWLTSPSAAKRHDDQSCRFGDLTQVALSSAQYRVCVGEPNTEFFSRLNPKPQTFGLLLSASVGDNSFDLMIDGSSATEQIVTYVSVWYTGLSEPHVDSLMAQHRRLSPMWTGCLSFSLASSSKACLQRQYPLPDGRTL